jgi:hypothetical protein
MISEIGAAVKEFFPDDAPATRPWDASRSRTSCIAASLRPASFACAPGEGGQPVHDH